MVKRSMRLEYGKYLAELGARNDNIIALEADLKESTQSIQFQKAYPKRYFEVGVAEQNMIGISAGFALEGKIPIAHSFACFISMRSLEQLRTSVAYPRLNVKLVASHAGISAGTAGTTHHAIEDIAILRSIPNMTVLVPGDVEEMKQAVNAAIMHQGPVYIRISAMEVEDVYRKTDRFSIGKATDLRDGNDATIISTGVLVYEAVSASDILLRDFKVRARVLQMASVKPIDRKAVLRAARDTGNIVTIEEHNILGGLGSAVCEIAAEETPAKVKRLGINDHFCKVGSALFLMKDEKLTTENIVTSVLNMVSNNN